MNRQVRTDYYTKIVLRMARALSDNISKKALPPFLFRGPAAAT
jgi:hypothetical protein